MARTNKRLSAMMAKPPAGHLGPPKLYPIWKRMKPMTFRAFKLGWKLVEKKEPLTDMTVAKFAEWADIFNTRYFGMQMRQD